MSAKTKEIYSEVNSILNMLGENYINKLPEPLLKIIEEEKDSNYTPIYDSNIKLSEQNIKRESISMIALFHINYWSDEPEQKEQLKKIFRENEIKYQEELQEKYNPNNIFKNHKTEKIKENGQEIQTNNKLVKNKKQNIFLKIINKIKSIFTKN